MDLDKAVDRIIADLTGRCGFDHVWDDCDQSIRAEIRQALRTILEEEDQT
jgi:hypothetical protein